jgi:hypothetical protein
VQVVQETPYTSIESPNEEGHSEPLETTLPVMRVRFPSPAPTLQPEWAWIFVRVVRRRGAQIFFQEFEADLATLSLIS